MTPVHNVCRKVEIHFQEYLLPVKEIEETPAHKHVTAPPAERIIILWQ
jgi:hypothetical protein